MAGQRLVGDVQLHAVAGPQQDRARVGGDGGRGRVGERLALLARDVAGVGDERDRGRGRRGSRSRWDSPGGRDAGDRRGAAARAEGGGLPAAQGGEEEVVEGRVGVGDEGGRGGRVELAAASESAAARRGTGDGSAGTGRRSSRRRDPRGRRPGRTRCRRPRPRGGDRRGGRVVGVEGRDQRGDDRLARRRGSARAATSSSSVDPRDAGRRLVGGGAAVPPGHPARRLAEAARDGRPAGRAGSRALQARHGRSGGGHPGVTKVRTTPRVGPAADRGRRDAEQSARLGERHPAGIGGCGASWHRGR